MRVLFIGDIFGRPGRRAVREYLPELRKAERIDFVVANAENAAGGKGVTPDIARDLFDLGVDVISSGNHTREKKEIDSLLESDPRLLRPLNAKEDMPGSGFTVQRTPGGREVAVVSAIGSVQMRDAVSPFAMLKERIEDLRRLTTVVLVDFHAEATSEKRAMGWWLDGLATAVIGTHTHVPTADEEILPGGTAYITDIGMTGPYNSVIGMRTDLALERFLTGQKKRFDVGRGDVRFCGAIVDVDDASGRALAIRRVRHDIGTAD